MKSRLPLILLIVLLVAGLAARLAYLEERRLAPDYQQPLADAAFHDYWAQSLVSGDWTPPEGEGDPQIQSVPFLRPPGYPYALAAFYRIGGASPDTARYFQIALGLLGVVLTYALGRALFRPSVGLVAAAGAAFYWTGIYFEQELQAVALIQVLLLGALLLLNRVRTSWPAAIAAGVVLGLLALVRANALLLIPIAALWIALETPRAWGRAAAVFVFALLAILPATVRNQQVSGETVLISANGPINLWIGNNPEADGVSAKIPDLARITGRSGWSWFSYGQIVEGVRAQRNDPEMSYQDVANFFSAVAQDWIRANPGEFVGLCLKRAALFWGPQEVSNNKAVRFEKASHPVLAASPSWPWLATFAFVGFGWFWVTRRAQRGTRKGDEEPARADTALLVGLFVVVWFLSFVPFLAATRFRAPVAPLLWLFAAWALVEVVRALRAQRFAAVGGAAVAALVLFVGLNRAQDIPEVDLAWWHTDRAHAYVRTGDTFAGESEFYEALNANSGYLDAHVGLAELLESQDRVDEALQHYLFVVQARPDRTRVMLKTAVLLLQQGRAEQAVGYLDTVAQQSPDNPDVRFEYGRALIEVGRFEDGVRELRESIALQPENPQAYTNLGIGLAKLGRADDAVQALRESIVLSPFTKESYFELGNVLHSLQRHDEAKEAFAEAARVGLGYIPPLVHRGNLHNELGEFAEAVEWYEKALAVNPNHVVARFNAAGSLANLGRFAEAEGHLEVALQADPGHGPSRQRLQQVRTLMRQREGQ